MGFLKKIGKGVGNVLKSATPLVAKLGIPVVSQAAGIVSAVTSFNKPAPPQPVASRPPVSAVNAITQMAQDATFSKSGNLSAVAESKTQTAAQNAVFGRPATLANFMAQPTTTKTTTEETPWYKKISGWMWGVIVAVVVVIGYFIFKKKKR